MPEFTSVFEGKNKVGTRFAIWRENRKGTYSVMKLCANYNGRVRGGIKYTWRYLEKGLDWAAARDLCNRRLKGRER